MLNMLPKLELVPISRYFRTLPKDLRPAMIPAWSTPRPGSSRMMSEASRATSTASATEIPTSAACSEGASLMPSPRNPTTCPCALRARMIRCFCAGETRANTRVCSATRASAASSMPSISLPSTMRLASRPTRPQMWRVTSSLSPVRIFTSTPSSRRLAIDSAAPASRDQRRSGTRPGSARAHRPPENQPDGPRACRRPRGREIPARSVRGRHRETARGALVERLIRARALA